MERLEHGNILPFYGVSTIEGKFGLAFPWYKNGNIVEYLKKRRPGFSRLALVSEFQ